MGLSPLQAASSAHGAAAPASQPRACVAGGPRGSPAGTGACSPQAAGAAARRRDRSGAGGRLTPDWQPAPLFCATGDGPAGPRWPQSPSRLRPNRLFALSGRCAASFLPSSRFPESLLRARPVRGPNHTVATPSYE